MIPHAMIIHRSSIVIFEQITKSRNINYSNVFIAYLTFKIISGVRCGPKAYTVNDGRKNASEICLCHYFYIQ